MSDRQLSTLSRFFAQRRASRRALAVGGASLVATGLASRPVVAQEASPEPDASNGPEMLFVQSFQSGSIAPVVGTDGHFTVTLEHGLGQTIYFSDRPDRIVGASPTGQFLNGLGFTSDDPPNAALVVESASGETDIAVIELFNPIYDEASHTATYEAVGLANWQDSLEIGFSVAPSDLAAIAPAFGAAHLFIDGCPDGVITCQSRSGPAGDFASNVFGGFCFSSTDQWCLPCTPWHPNTTDAFGFWEQLCNAEFPKCDGACEPFGVSRGGNKAIT